jgi:plasmid stabilization system protein ParE
MTVELLGEARSEFLDAANYYKTKEPALGIRFRNEIASVVDWISQNSEVPRLRPRGYRRVNLRTFPYYVAYVIKDDTIWVVAVANAFRKPEHWISRLEDL